MKDESGVRGVSAEYALKHRVLPLREEGGTVYVAVVDRPDHGLLQELQFVFNKPVVAEPWPEEALLTAISRRYRLGDGAVTSGELPARFEALEGSSPGEDAATVLGDDHSVIQTVNHFISEAIRLRASDIHVESYEETFRIRFRIDGKLLTHDHPPTHRKPAVISRLKIMAGMDIAEKRRPQDGRIRMRSGSRRVDIRVSTLPTDFGEKVVLRILDPSALNLALENLGMEAEPLERFRRVLGLPYGMLLVTGPTGSGKTTTLYAGLQHLNQPERNIVSIEDPVEYNLPGINQVAVRPELGLGFAPILRTVLRQDPNVIMIGEIRDSETAAIAVRAALTGHLVLSTLHTNDAVSTIARLIDMGIEPFLLASSLKMVLAQRLVRRICPSCKREAQIDWEKFRSHGLPPSLQSKRFFEGAGCDGCQHTGYRGREALVARLPVDERVAAEILRGGSTGELRRLAAESGYRELNDVALQKALDGRTSLDEAVYETFMG